MRAANPGTVVFRIALTESHTILTGIVRSVEDSGKPRPDPYRFSSAIAASCYAAGLINGLVLGVAESKAAGKMISEELNEEEYGLARRMAAAFVDIHRTTLGLEPEPEPELEPEPAPKPRRRAPVRSKGPAQAAIPIEVT